MDRRSLGAAAEDLAAQELRRRGYVVIDRNVRLRGGELDLVCRDGATFVIAEVKARRPSAFGAAVEAITVAKRARLHRLAESYLARVGSRGAPYRIELIAIALSHDGAVRHVDVVPFG